MSVTGYILAKSKIAYTIINTHALAVEEYNTAFKNICALEESLTAKSVLDLIPEFIGLEEEFEKIILGEKVSFNLPFLNKNKKSYNCTIEFYNETKPALLITFEDVSDTAGLKQQIVQRENEINILKAQLSTQNGIAISEIIGESPRIQKIKKIIPRIAQIEASSILLEGETGTGKSLLANIIHNSSPKSKSPFVEINCAAIPETLLEAELFGNVKGAFTNAITDRVGLIESANGGTLFLDEISELTLNLQAKLLSFLETRKFRPLGSNKEKTVQLRLIVATNKNLAKSVEEGTFREDLFYRLNVVPLLLPPLREMENDPLLLAEYFIERFNKIFNKKVKGLTKFAAIKLLAHNWSGNVRELSNCIEQAMIFVENDILTEDDILIRKHLSKRNNIDYDIPDSGIDLETMEIEYIKSALQKSKGNKSTAAKLLGLSRDTFRYRLEKYKIN